MVKQAIKPVLHPFRVLLSKLVIFPTSLPYRPHGFGDLSLLEKVAYFVSSDKIEGDYLEFGVFRGGTLIESYRAMSRIFKQRIGEVGHNATAEDARERQEIWDQMRFFAFDSFEGLPELEGIDKETRDFSKGQYAMGLPEVKENLTAAGVPLDRVVFVPGWFDQTSTAETRERHQIRKAAVIWVDCDLYHSARSALNFITPLLHDGTVIVFDDWYTFRGNPQRGEQKAFAEWKETVPGFTFAEYPKGGPWRVAFLASAT